MRFTFTVNINVDRTEGKFATRDEIRDQLVEALEGADPASLEGDEGGQYETNEWNVEEEIEATKPKRQPEQKAQRVNLGKSEDAKREEST